jgi:hypothetical protein
MSSLKNPVKVAMGKKSRAAGKAFELKVRKDLEEKGWIVCKWQNNVDLEQGEHEGDKVKFGNGKLIPAKHTFNPFTKAMSAGNGFPDFICTKKLTYPDGKFVAWDIQLVESKMTGKLDKVEKEKVEWIKEHLNIPVFMAYKGEKRGEILYEQQ